MKLVAKQDVLMWVFLIWSTYAAALPMWCCSALLTLGPLLHTCLKELMLKSVGEMIGVLCVSFKAMYGELGRINPHFHQSEYCHECRILGIILDMAGRKMLMSS
jgi:hypothetical protein